MKSLWISLALIAAFSVAGNLPISAQSPEQLYQEGLMKEEGEGALQDAIALYNQIADDGNADQSLRAKALLHIGMCYEKMGTQEAVKSYQRLVSSFPNQKNEVAIAKERLNRLLLVTEKIHLPSLSPKFTKVPIPTKLSWSVRLSPDGGTLALVSEEKIFLIPLSGNLGPGIPGVPIELNTNGIDVEYTDLSWSNDGQWIAFNDLAKENSNQSIYIVPSKGGRPEKIIENYRDARIVNYRISLSPDGKVLAFSSVQNNQQHIFTVPVKGGDPSQLTDMQAREPTFSPDGKLIAFVEDRELGSAQGGLGLWIVSSEGGTPHQVANSGTASSPVWSPDGKMIAFLDYSQGGHQYSKNIFIVPVSEEGKITGEVAKVRIPEDIGEARMLAGWTPENRIGALCMTKQEFALYTLPAKGGQAAMVLNDCYALQPRWSPDGKQIFYTTPPLTGDNRFRRLFLASIPAEGGTGKPLPVKQNNSSLRPVSFQGGNRVSPDGKWIISAMFAPDDIDDEFHFPKTKIWKLAIDGNVSKQVTRTEGAYVDLSPSWSPDGKSVSFVRTELTVGMDPFNGGSGIYVVNASGGEPESLISVTGKYIISPVWSHDGTMIAYLTGNQQDRSNPTLNVINVNTRESKAIGEVPKANVNIELAWSPDNRRIAFNGKKIHIMNVDDGSIEDIETNLVDVGIWHLDWSPDGQYFVFAGGKGGKDEFCFLEDFLPLDKLPHEPAKIEDEKSDAITIRQVWSGEDTDNCGTVSPNGELLSFMDGETGNLAIRKLSSAKNVLLTSEGSWDDPMHFALNNVISHDGKRIAYSWYSKNGTYDLKIIDLENKVSSTVYASDSLEEIYPVAWSLTDDTIIVQHFIPVENSYNWQLSFLNPLNGQLSPIKEFKTSFMINLALDSDDTYMAYDFPKPDQQGRFDINLRELHSGKDIPLVQHPANDRVLGWIPETDKFLFTSDRSGTTDIYAITVPGSCNISVPKRIVVNIGKIDPMGFTEKGSLYYSLSERKFESFIAQIDPVTGEIIDNPKTSLLGSLGDVCWLPDGESMICVKLSQGPDNRSDYTLCHMNIQTGKLRDLANQIMVNGMPRVSPDLRSILFYGIDKTSLDEEVVRRGLYITDLNTGSAEFLQVKEDASRSYSAEWDAEGTSVFYTSNGRIIRHYLGTGQEEVIYENPQLEIPTLRRSLDGEHLIFDLQATEEEKHLISIPVNGGEPVTICKIHASGTPLMYKKIAISPEGDYIYYTLKGSESGSVIWRIPSSGGKAEKIWYSKNMITGISLHPDGKRVAISVYRRNLEIRVLENLFAELNKAFKPDE